MEKLRVGILDTVPAIQSRFSGEALLGALVASSNLATPVSTPHQPLPRPPPLPTLQPAPVQALASQVEEWATQRSLGMVL